MTLRTLLNQRKMSAYQLSKSSQIPYSTISDLVNEKTMIENSTIFVVSRIAKALDMTLDELVNSITNEPELKRVPFERFKHALRHQLHALGDKAVLKKMLIDDEVETYASRQWYPEALYILGMLDYLCRQHQLPLASKYDAYRDLKLDQVLYPADIHLLSLAQHSDRLKQESFEKSIPEFKRFNIVEGDIRNVI